MGFVSPDRVDVCLSFLGGDNAPCPGGNEGWVSTLARDLMGWLDDQFGEGNGRSCSFVLDERLATGAPFAADDWSGLGAAVVLLVVSRETLGRLWPNPDLEGFRAAIGRRVATGGRVVLVELDNVAGARPPLFDGLPTYHFWAEDPVGKQVRTLGVPRTNPLDRGYLACVTALRDDVLKELRRLRPVAGAHAAGRGLEAAEVKTTVYLAESPNALDGRRLEVRRYLEQAGVRVIPEGPYPRDPTAFEAAVRHDLARSALFVQLLGVPSASPALGDNDPRGRARAETEARLQAKIKAEEYDVFLCHNSEHKDYVKGIGGQLKALGIRPWLDEWDLKPGEYWLDGLADGLSRARAAAVFLGPGGSGPWQEQEIRELLIRSSKARKPLIPIVMPGVEGEPESPPFLAGLTWVDFRKQDPDPIGRLCWGITGVRPDLSAAAEPPVAVSGPTDLPDSLVVVQHTLALQAGLPVLQWIPLKGSADNTSVSRSLSALPDRSTALAMTLVDFEALVLQRVREFERERDAPSPKRAPAGVGSKLVFVNADPADRTVAERVVAALKRIGAGVVPAYKADPSASTRKYIEEMLKRCDAYVVVYGAVTGVWVGLQLVLSRNLVAFCEQQPRMAIYEAPPRPKEDVMFEQDGLDVIQGELEPDEPGLVAFLRRL